MNREYIYVNTGRSPVHWCMIYMNDICGDEDESFETCYQTMKEEEEEKRKHILQRKHLGRYPPHNLIFILFNGKWRYKFPETAYFFTSSQTADNVSVEKCIIFSNSRNRLGALNIASILLC